MKPFLIIKVGGTFPEYRGEHGDFEHWTADGMGLESGQWKCVRALDGEMPERPDVYAGCVITGAHEMVTEGADWMQETGAWVVNAAKAGLPILGICFGHQLMAQSFGGEAGYHPKGMEIGTVSVAMNENAETDPLFSNLPKSFQAHVTHSQTALKVAKDAVVLGGSDHDQHQAVRFADDAWGVQFHPEFNATDISYYVEQLAGELEKQGRNVPAIRESVEETPVSAGLLTAFVAYCRARD